jgi:hypothetical protein
MYDAFDAEEKISFQNRFVGQIQQSISAAKYCNCFSNMMWFFRRFSSSEIIIIHTRQIIMNQRISMNSSPLLLQEAQQSATDPPQRLHASI